MSRAYGDDYEENFPNEWAFWERRTQQVLHGRPGRKALAELRDALRALPEKRLVSGAISTVALRRKYADEPDEFAVPSWGDSSPTRPNWTKRDALAKCETEGDGVCAVGAYLWWQRVQAGEDPAEAMATLPSASDVEEYYLNETAAIGRDAGLSYTLAYVLACMNDELWEHCTPEERYEHFMAWLDTRLAVAS